MKDRTRINDLKQTIKALASQGRTLHTRIIELRAQPDTGPERCQLWKEKRSLGRDARCALLAYGFLRGMPYKAVEPKAVVGNVPWAGDIAPYVDPSYCKADQQAKDALRQAIKAWVEVKPAEHPATPAEASDSPNTSTEAA